MDSWEVPHSRLMIDYSEKIGAGAFSVVYKGKLFGDAPAIQSGAYRIGIRNNMEVAAKMAPEHSADKDNRDLLAEIKLMKLIGYHPHLLSMVACVTRANPVCLLTEFCANGSVLALIRKHREKLAQVWSKQNE